MENIVIAIGADHRGFFMKEYLRQELIFFESKYSITWVDVGAYNNKRSNYPEFAFSVVKSMQNKQSDYGVLLCGTGIGMAIAANKFSGIYAALAWDVDVARKAKEDDNANILVLPSDYIIHEKSRAMVCAWLGSEFKHHRYAQRIAMIDSFTP